MFIWEMVKTVWLRIIFHVKDRLFYFLKGKHAILA